MSDRMSPATYYHSLPSADGSNGHHRFSRNSIASSSAPSNPDHRYHDLSDVISETSIEVPQLQAFLNAHGSIAAINGASMEIPGSSAMRPRTFSFSTASLAGSLHSTFVPPSSEVTSLLGPPEARAIATAVDESEERFGLDELLQEMRLLSTYAIPIVGTHILEYSLLIVSVLSVGHLGTTELAAASLANITANCAALSVIIGFVSALDSLCPSAFTSPHPERTSLHALRTSILLVILLVPELLIFWHAKPIFLFLRQDPDVAAAASSYLRVLSFGLPGYAIFEVTRRWLQAQQLMLPPTLVVFIVAPINAILSYLLVWGPAPYGIGFLGAPAATAFSFNLMGILCLCYCIFFAPRTAWGGFTRAAFQELGPNFRFGLAGFTMIASEWWCWEIVGLSSSLLGPSTLAAQSIITTISTFVYQFPYATSAAAAVRCGNLLGAGMPRRAKLATLSALACGFCVGVVNMIIMVSFREGLGELFSSAPEVISIVADVLPLVALFQVPDCIAAVAGGVLRGLGKPNIGAMINSGGYYAVGLPIGLILTFSRINLGVYGLWIGMTIAVTCTASTCTLYILRTDYVYAMTRARQRMWEALGASHVEEQERCDYGTLH
ncbi:uncharacterized protein MELLADRAFT_45832 [Melampsora larici-populina 98AG31]|uniref:MATE efflux family protein n=1 Tax=Melampsora larici-populina (strain 98AG31 / pathotype 3-4-7) TaxID=747676 RepID=F4S8M1_MELLP|nr:uncharacterized protein MELLADRAFT_45832 [Melampsora larici-populina 98AG31]EGF99014.1 hypothetical protein MELLADRAFT_45832 [Melampsora larici-populina 98AG31]